MLCGLSYFISYVSDIWALYVLFSDSKIPSGVAIAYLVIFFVSLIIGYFDLSIANGVLKRQDLSAIYIDSLANILFQVRGGLASYGLISVISDYTSFFDSILIAILQVLQNAVRVLLVTFPQIVISITAAVYQSQGSSSSKIIIKFLPFLFKLLTLVVDCYKLFWFVMIYPFLRCYILLSKKIQMTLWDYINLRIEKVLNKMLKDKKLISGGKIDSS